MGKLCLLTSLFLAISYTAGVTDVIGGEGARATSQMAAGAGAIVHPGPKTKMKEVQVADGDDNVVNKCKLEDGKPMPETLTTESPKCVPGVPKAATAVGDPAFNCINVGTPPNQTCPWYLEDRMGCQVGMMCDTVSHGSGTKCKCQ